MPSALVSPVRRVEPLARDWRSAVWHGGSFDTARRPATKAVEGVIRMPSHLLLVTIRGGSRLLRVKSACGHAYEGPDEAGSVSFVPAGCDRALWMADVRAEWASLSLSAEALSGFSVPTLTHRRDPVLAGLAGEMLRLLDEDGALDPVYGEAVGLAAAQYLGRRFGGPATRRAEGSARLTPAQVRRVEAYVDDHLPGELRIADLAAQVGLSVGHFHRAWRESAGETPLMAVQRARVRRAVTIFRTEGVTIREVAHRVGFVSASHFGRVFRAATGVSPAAWLGRRREGGRADPAGDGAAGRRAATGGCPGARSPDA